MSYYVELSYDLRKHKSSEFKKQIIELGEKYQCYRVYEDFEISGVERTVKRNHCVITFVFNEDDIKCIEKFLRKIKKISKIYVECIYTDLYILYASKKYQRMFPNFKKEQIKIHSHETILLAQIKKTNLN